MSGEFGGKIVIVTGGAAGLGRAMCLEFARLGARVVCGDIALEDLRPRVALLEGGDELVGKLAGLAVFTVNTGVDLQKSAHAGLLHVGFLRP